MPKNAFKKYQPAPSCLQPILDLFIYLFSIYWIKRVTYLIEGKLPKYVLKQK